MTAAFALRRTAEDRSLLDSLEGVTKVGLDGVLDGRGHRAHRVRPRAAAVTRSYAWRFTDQWTQTWWPQGIAVGEHLGIPIALASWYAQPARRGEMGARVSVVDLRNPRCPRYRHVLLVAARKTDAGVVLDPVPVHAGGIVWSGDRLFVAATLDGVVEFRLSDVLRADSRGAFRRSSGPFGYRYLLPVFARYRPTAPKADNPLRYSFLSTASRSAMADAAEAAELLLLAGEFGTSDEHRVARVTLTGSGASVTALHVPRVPQMQGVALIGDRWYISSSQGDSPGDLWSGPMGSLRNNAGVLPAGPETLAPWPKRNELWSLSEVAGHRMLFAIDPARW